MKLGIAILNWNGRDLLEKYLPTIVSYSSSEATIYVIDNNSSDNSISYLKANYPMIIIIQNNDNYGFAEGYNKGLTQVDADLIGIVNSDIRVTKNWLLPIINIFEEFSNVAIVQPKICNDIKTDYFDYAGAGGGFIDTLGYPYCRGRTIDKLEKDCGQYDDTIDVFWASGACMFIRKDIFFLLGAFDTDYFAYHEEIDLCWRAHHLGYKIKYVGSSKVYHLGSASFIEGSSLKTFLNFRNSLYNIYKHIPFPKFLIIIFIRLFLDGMIGIFFIFTGKFKHTFSIIKSHFSFYYNIFELHKKRKSIKGHRYKNYDIPAKKIVLLKYLISKIRKEKDL